MILYDADAPSPRRVRIFLAEKGLDVERRSVDLRKGEHRQLDFRRINPRGTLPVIVLDDGAILTDSVAICRCIEALQPDPPLFGRTALEIGRIEEWIRRIDDEGYRSAVYAFRNRLPAFANRAVPGIDISVQQLPCLVDRAELVYASFAAALDIQLQRTPWVAGDNFSFADICALVAVDFAERAKLRLVEELRHLARWRIKIGRRASSQA